MATTKVQTFWLVAALAAVAIATAWWVFATPFDGWTRSQEDDFINNCQVLGAPESVCACVVDELQEDDVTALEANAPSGFDVGFDAGVLCGFRGG